MASNQSTVPPGCVDLLIPPAEIADAWQRYGQRGRLVMALAAEHTSTEAEFCHDLSLRLWHVVNSYPFLPAPSGTLSQLSPPAVASVERWLWDVTFALKARALTLDPSLPWPPHGPSDQPDWPWPR